MTDVCLESYVSSCSCNCDTHRRTCTQMCTHTCYLSIYIYETNLSETNSFWASLLAWSVPGTGEPGGLPSMGSHRVGHDWSDLAAWALWFYNRYSFLDVPEYLFSMVILKDRVLYLILVTKKWWSDILCIITSNWEHFNVTPANTVWFSESTLCKMCVEVFVPPPSAGLSLEHCTYHVISILSQAEREINSQMQCISYIGTEFLCNYVSIKIFKVLRVLILYNQENRWEECICLLIGLRAENMINYILTFSFFSLCNKHDLNTYF